ncbi:MaoC/PaaZ C-terminal domain-containing protein [Brevundimonas sp.]|uniref:MaoC family dehydratase n=1 Tax=Brevundimonas sp. TaxID=1871086 RepID=UPI0028ACFA0B|nr:MaoC/PaaZ C-terminal domain-containing protein [Brevundimonas sp.]
MTATGGIERFDAPLSGAAVIGGALRGMLRAKGGEAVLPQRALQREAGLEAEAIGAYARLCGFAPEQGVPITWPHILAFPLQMRLMLGRDFPFPAMGLVHLHNRIRQQARLNIGDRLTLTARPGRFLSHDKGQAFTLETTATRDGATVWDGTSLYLHLGRRGQGDPVPVLSVDEADRLVESWTLPANLGRRYAHISGDANPIHTSALGARLFGFRRAVAHGMWTKARAVAALSPPAPLNVAEVEVAFRAPLFLPGQVGLYAGPAGDIRDFEVRDATGARVHLRGRLTPSSGGIVAC